MSHRLVAPLLFCLCLVFIGQARPASANWPERAIQVIVPNGAGGSTDLTTRLVAQPLSDRLGQGLAIINIPGAGTSIGAQKAARSRADGYVLLSTHEAFLTSSALNLNRLGPASMRPVAQVAKEAVVIAVHPGSPLQGLDDYYHAVAPGHTGAALKLGVNPGAVSHFTLMRTLTGIEADVILVPTGGGAKSLKSLMGGHIDVASFTVSEFEQLANAGSLRALAVFDAQRHPKLPGTPTALEQGHDILLGVHYTWYAPAGTPEHVVNTLASALRSVTTAPSFIELLDSRALTPAFSAGKELESALQERYSQMQSVAEAIRQFSRKATGAADR
jgi:tripartite-type tricarboxylate transporter receptor subunit TctC